jgi:hypothetical protein
MDLEPGAPRVGGADLEAGGEDDAVDRVLDAVHHQAGLGDPIDAAPAGVDQRHVRPVEGLVVVRVQWQPLGAERERGRL